MRLRDQSNALPIWIVSQLLFVALLLWRLSMTGDLINLRQLLHFVHVQLHCIVWVHALVFEPLVSLSVLDAVASRLCCACVSRLVTGKKESLELVILRPITNRLIAATLY